MPVRCLIVDDEPLALDALASLLAKIPDIKVTDRCQDAVSALQVLHRGQTDLVFLDIEMPELSGLEMLKTLASPPKVIFTTAYREYAVEAFELNVVDYLVKPISLERLIKAINRYMERRGKTTADPAGSDSPKEETVTFYSDKKTCRIHTSDILFVEGLKDYALIHTDHGRLIIRQTMKSIEEMLAPFEFIRVHRSWIVPYRKLTAWTNHSVLVGDQEIPVGQTYRQKILEYLDQKNG
jgi:DNA-binding LytR/AlgR family response regulator